MLVPVVTYPNNHMAMLRRTKQWMFYMKKGMATEIRNVQIAKRKGQLSLFDMYDAEDLLEIKQCIFDSIDQMVWDDDTLVDEGQKFDPEVA
ncbi:MAG: hypothetical protein JL50_08315 [Peptococcaceae bacterium BICA1-7]|nr:MAG: hypothetical protein JL50_08315 [Peptococcaceae bacterium BICA1-7]HBV97434.1 hypothetical protein [Desulfotomaculum sp.]